MSKVAKADIFEYVVRLGDNALILGQRLGAWCGHAPALEEDIATTNTALDLIGQAQLWLAYAAELEGKKRSADDLAFLREERTFKNCLLVEQPNGDFGQTLMRQFLFDTWHYFFMDALKSSKEERIANIAEKAVKEVTYHLERSTDLVIRLGDGTEESHDIMQRALTKLWGYSGELTTADELDTRMQAAAIGPDMNSIKERTMAYYQDVFQKAFLITPENTYMHTGGKRGLHSENLGPLLAEMQYLQRAYPGAKW